MLSLQGEEEATLCCTRVAGRDRHVHTVSPQTVGLLERSASGGAEETRISPLSIAVSADTRGSAPRREKKHDYGTQEHA